MKQKIFLFSIISLLLITSVLALDPRFDNKAYNIKVVAKNPITWTTVDGASGNVMLSKGDKADAIVRDASPFTAYTLIYYGDAAHNDVWPFATCITSGVTNKHGMLRMDEKTFNYAPLTKDTIGQKFWIVLSSDVDCANSKMTAWNPTQYLFESKVL